MCMREQTPGFQRLIRFVPAAAIVVSFSALSFRRFSAHMTGWPRIRWGRSLPYPAQNACGIVLGGSGHDRSGSSVKRKYLLWMDAIELGQQHDALLLVGIRAGNNRNAALRRAEVMGQMRHTGRDVDKVPGPRRELFFEPLAIPHAGFAAENIDGGFVTIVFVRLRPSTGWNGHYLQVDSLRIYRFGRDPGRIQKRLLANEFRTGTHNPASWHPTEAVSSFRTCIDRHKRRPNARNRLS